MRKAFYILLGFVSVAVWGQIPSQTSFVAPNRPAVSPVGAEVAAASSAKVAGLNEDMEALRKEVHDLSLRVEVLEAQKTALETKASAGTGSYATREELKLAENRANEALSAESKRVEAAILEEIRAAKKQTAIATPASPAVAAGSVAPKATEGATDKPTLAGTGLTAPATASEKEAFLKEGARHVVQKGETLRTIAKKYHSSPRAIVVANDLTNPDKLFVGKELFVPTLK